MSKLFGLAILTFVFASPATAAEENSKAPRAEKIMQAVKAVLDPDRSGVREFKVLLSTASGRKRTWEARQAWKTDVNGLNRLVLVMEKPSELRGAAILVKEREERSNEQWVWIPVVDRVRKIVPIGRFQGVFGSDFSYADLGFLSLHGRVYGEVRESEIGGVGAYVVTERVPDERWYYSRVETYVERSSLLPLQRLFYDEAGDLWKTQVFEKIEDVDGKPTLYAMRMRNEFDEASSTIVYEDVQYRDLPEDLMDPKELPRLLDHSVWTNDAANSGAGHGQSR